MPTHRDSPVPLRIRFHEKALDAACIKVVGVGGGGSNAINRMIEIGVEGVEFISINTDLQSLRSSKARIQLQIGARLTHGLGAGADPEIGRQAAIEASDEIIGALQGADMVFITAGLGGGTGTGAAPVIASIASQMGLLTVAIVTRPFEFEGKRRLSQAERGVQGLLDCVDTLIVIPNQRLVASAPDTGFFESFQITDDVLRHAVQSISDIITIPGFINRDFADVKMTMAGMGYAVMGTAVRSGPHRATQAALAAIASPLLEAGAIDGARGILINISGSSSLRLSEVNDASTIIQTAAHSDANIIFGAVLDERLGDEIKITLIATGFHQESRDRAQRRLRLLQGAEEPATVVGNESQRERESSMEVRGVEDRQTDDDEREPETPGLATSPARETGSQVAATHTLAADELGLQEARHVYKEPEASAEVPPAGFYPDHEPIDASLPGILTTSDEQDLLANLDGPPIDLDFILESLAFSQTSEPPIPPEISRLRQAAMTAYLAVSATQAIETESEPPTVGENATFSEILQSRLKTLELDEIESDELLDEGEFPHQQPIALAGSQGDLKDDREAESDSQSEGLRLQRPSADVTTDPEFAHPPALDGAVPPLATDATHPTVISVLQTARTVAPKIPTPDFNRRLNREPDFSAGVEVI